MKTAILTGTTSGIGYELTLQLIHEAKYEQLILISRNEKELQSFCNQWNQTQKKVICHYEVCDLSSPEQVRLLITRLNERLKNCSIELLVNNAGYGVYGEFTQTSLDKELQMIQTNISALVHLTKFVLPYMKQSHKGKIMNVASTAAFLPGPLMAVYYATKAFVLSFSEALSKELKDTGIEVICLCPGPTESKFQKTANLEKSRMLERFKTPSSSQVASFAMEALRLNKRIAIHGFSNRILAFLIRFLPRKLVTHLVYRIQEAKEPTS